MTKFLLTERWINTEEEYFDKRYFYDSFKNIFNSVWLKTIYEINMNEWRDVPKVLAIYTKKDRQTKEKEITFPYREYYTFVYYIHLQKDLHINMDKEIKELCNKLDEKYLS